MDAPNSHIDEIDQSFSISGFRGGIIGVMGQFKRGPVNNPKELIFTTWNQFIKIMGAFIDSQSDAPHLVKRIFDKGGQVRVNRIGHYSTIADATTLTAKPAAVPYKHVMTLSAALVASNVFNATINGVGITPVTFATSSDATLSAIAVALAAHADITSASVVTVTGTTADDRSIIFYSDKNAVELVLTGFAITLGVSQATVTVTSIGALVDTASNVGLFGIQSKYEGVDYNNLTLVISDATNGDSGSFDVAITHALEPVLNESYKNIKIPGRPTAAESVYLKDLKNGSSLVDLTYADLSGVAGSSTLRPVNGSYPLVGGTDGGSIVVTDYSGSSTGLTGVYAFNEVDDIMDIAVLDNFDNTLPALINTYASNRQDLFNWSHIDNSFRTAAQIIAERATMAVDDSYTAFTAGGIKVIHPTTGAVKELAELGDILGLVANTDNFFGPWYAAGGLRRGVVKDAVGVVNNFGSTGQTADLNLLSNRQVNCMIQRHAQVVFWNNVTALLSESHLNQISIRRFLIWLKKSLKPTLEKALLQPNDPITWKALYFEVKPFLDRLKSQRALYDYAWQGDQFAKDLSSLQINDRTDVGRGKYKARLLLNIIPGILEIGVDLVITRTDVSFEDFSINFDALTA